MSNAKPSISFLVFLLSLVAVLGISYTWQQEVAGQVGDDAIYLLLADYFSPYDSAARAGAAFIMNFKKFPPLYPALLAIAGAGSKYILMAHLVTTLCIIIAVALYWWWLVKEGVDRYFALLISGLFLSLPATMIVALDLWSEHLYLALTLLSLHLAHHARTTGKGWPGIALIAGLVPITRWVGLTFIAAMWAFLIIHKIPNRRRLMALSAVPLLLWTLISVQFESSVPYATKFKYLSSLSPDGLRSFLMWQIFSLWRGWHASFDFLMHTYSAPAPALLLIMATVGWWRRFKSARLDALYLPLYLALIILWPALDAMARYLYVVMPLLLYYGFTGFSMMVKKYASSGVAPILQTSFLVLIIFSSAQIVTRRIDPPEPDLAAYAGSEIWVKSLDLKATNNTLRTLKYFVAAFQEAANYVEPSQCISSIYEEIFMFYAHRLVLPPPMPGVSPEEFNSGISRCRYAYVFWATGYYGYPPGYPWERLKQRGEILFLTRMSANPNSPLSGGFCDCAED